MVIQGISIAIASIKTEGLKGGVVYYDGQFDDSRLLLNLVATAAEQGATLLNYVEVTGLIRDDDGFIHGVVARDRETGQQQELRSRVVINATGIFSVSIRLLDDPAATPAVQPSQGVHLVFDRSFLAGDSAIMVPHTDDGRVLFVIPWHGKVLVGTTDTAMEHADIEPRAMKEEVGFILRNAAKYLAKVPEEKDILSVFAGQRPLVRPPGKGGGATKAISRNHEILVSDSGLVTIVGGKWTTYRKMAEDTVDHAITLGGLDDRPCVTANLQLHGWRAPNAAALPMGIAAYGSEASKVEALMKSEPFLAQLIHPKLAYPLATVVWAARHEQARTLEDVLSRRTRALVLDARSAIEAAPAVATILARELGHDKAWADSQVTEFTKLAEGYLN